MTIRVEGETIYSAEDISLPFVSDKILTAKTKGIVIQAELVGAPDGFLDIEVSSQMEEKSETVTIWSRIHRETVLGVEDYLFFLKDAGYKWFRVRWTPNGGSAGSLSARYTYKGEW